MASPVDQYTRELSDQFHYVATWTPGTQIRLGDIGEMNGHEFTPKSSVRSLGIRFGILRDTSPETWDYQSAGQVAILAKAKGELSPAVPSVPKGRAGLGIEFSTEGAVVVHAEGCTANRIADIVRLEDDIWDLWDRYVWDEKWVVVTELVTATRATILLAATRNAKVELEASGSAKVPVGGVSLGSNLAVVSRSGMHTIFVNDRGLTPFFRGIRIKKDLLRRAQVTQVRTPAATGGTAVGPRRRHAARPSGHLTETIDS